MKTTTELARLEVELMSKVFEVRCCGEAIGEVCEAHRAARVALQSAITAAEVCLSKMSGPSRGAV